MKKHSQHKKIAFVYIVFVLIIQPVIKTHAQWAPLGNYPAYNGSFSYSLLSLTKDKRGNLYAAGAFTNCSSNFSVAKWNGNSWFEVGGTNTSTFNGNILSLSTDASGNLYAAGNFTNGNGKNYVAKWNGILWSEVGGTNTSTFNKSNYSGIFSSYTHVST